MHMCTVIALEKFKIRVCQGVSWGKNTILCHFCLFFEIFCLFLQFSTLESCYIWFTISLEYSSAYVFSCWPGKIQNQGQSGGIWGVEKPYFEPFLPIFEIFVFFFSFPHWNHVIFGLQLVQSILVHICRFAALENFKIIVCQGVRKHYFQPFLHVF